MHELRPNFNKETLQKLQKLMKIQKKQRVWPNINCNPYQQNSDEFIEASIRAGDGKVEKWLFFTAFSESKT